MSKIGKTILENGIRIVSKKTPYVRSISMGMWVNAGARDETSSENGLSHFIEHMIFKGTRRRSAYQIAKEFDAIGGQNNAFTTMENTCYYAKVMDTHLDTMTDILLDTFLNSVFEAAEIERERTVILQEIGMVEDTPDEHIHVLSGNTFWGDHPLGRSVLGVREKLLQFNANHLKDFFCRFYQPDRMVVSAAGNIDHDRFVDLLGPALSTIKPGNGFPERTPAYGRTLVESYYRELEQTHIIIGTRGLSITDPKRFIFSLLNTILGGNMSSRLFQEIRERHGLAYSVYSFTSPHVDSGMFGVYAGVDPNQAVKATSLIFKELKKLKEVRIDQSELDDAKEFTKGSLLLASESVDNQMVRLAQNEIHFNEFIPLETVVKEIEAVTPKEIQDLAKELFNSDQLAITLLGPIPDKAPYVDLLGF
ncbi:MAG: pitrilysin family protein [Desulfobacterales bacterium]